MFHGLMKDSAIVGTYKHIKHSTKPKRGRKAKAQSLSGDLQDLVNGFREISKIAKQMNKTIKKMKGRK